MESSSAALFALSDINQCEFGHTYLGILIAMRDLNSTYLHQGRWSAAWSILVLLALLNIGAFYGMLVDELAALVPVNKLALVYYELRASAPDRLRWAQVLMSSAAELSRRLYGKAHPCTLV